LNLAVRGFPLGSLTYAEFLADDFCGVATL
jgi:hypothetical protein